MPLTLNKVSKRAGDKWTLRDVEFDIAEGEIFGIYGGTGSGKTSLLKAISGEEKLNGGIITGHQNAHLACLKTKSGISGLFGGSQSKSDGETKTAAFKSAIESGAKLILLDDILTGIDRPTRHRLFTELREVAKRSGTIVVYASSNFEQIASICDRVAVLVDGEVAQIGFPHEVYQNPASSAVAQIVGTNNLIAARRLTSTDADLPEFQTIDGGHRLLSRVTAKASLGAINQNVTLAIRPEHVSISFDASFPEDNILKAVVTKITFLGATTIVTLDAGGLMVDSRVFRVFGLNIGDECMIAIPPHRIQVLKA